jgi:hypothetical protein
MGGGGRLMIYKMVKYIRGQRSKYSPVDFFASYTT